MPEQGFNFSILGGREDFMQVLNWDNALVPGDAKN